MKIETISGIKTTLVKQLIKTHNFTQQSYADEIGLSRQGLLRILKDGSTRLVTAERMAEVFNLKVEDIT